MDWLLRSPQIHSTFSNLGFTHADGYHVNENCNDALESILHNILAEDKYLRTYRRSISFGQNIKKDLIPLLLNAKEDKTIELLTKILVNLTIPIECLLSIDVISKTDFGRHTIFEINNLLASTKIAFTDNRATKVVIDFLKKNVNLEVNTKLSSGQSTNISNSLLLLRNILHIPEDSSGASLIYNAPVHTVQNQIMWNIFSQSIDKILIRLMTVTDANKWGVTMVQLIALLYKDQHVVTLHKLLNIWLEASLSESSEDNESNTSPPERGSEDSSPMLTSDPTSDSSDTGGSGKSNDDLNSAKHTWGASSITNNTSDSGNQNIQPVTNKSDTQSEPSTNNITHEKSQTDNNSLSQSTPSAVSEKQSEKKTKYSNSNEKNTVISETSDCGYGTQMETQETVSASSNEDDLPSKPVHQKPHNPKQRVNNNKNRTGISLQERKRKKVVKRGKANIVNVQGLSQKTPTDDDISNILKEFTVDFLLKGYNTLVQTLHDQILTNIHLEIDTSHFFWLVTYFLKFATQIELDLEHVSAVLSYEIVSYLTAEGANLCEQFELAIKLDGNDLKPSLRRLHLVVTAIREFVQAIEIYKKFTHLGKDDQDALLKLQFKMCETEELRSLLVLLLRHYNPKYHSKQYLQDLIVTNHILLMFLDTAMKLPEYNGSANMIDHIKQFATPKIMYQYGSLLEDYASNGEFVNDCIFTIMHHVGGDLGSLISLYQPNILRAFTFILKSEFEICDDWSDLIEYVINTFVKKPQNVENASKFRLDMDEFDDDKVFLKPKAVSDTKLKYEKSNLGTKRKASCSSTNGSNESWTEDELSSLSWIYMQCNSKADVIGEIVKLFKEDGITKSRHSVLQELLMQNIVNKDVYDKLKGESDKSAKMSQSKDAREDELGKLCEQLALDGKSQFLDWVQQVLLDTCLVKIVLKKKLKGDNTKEETKIMDFELFRKKSDEIPLMSPVSYLSLQLNKSVALVPWNCEQAAICKDLKFLQLLHKLGFHMPVDSGKVFIRIPHFWSAEFLYQTACKIGPVHTSKLKFSIKDLSESCVSNSPGQNCCHLLSVDPIKDIHNNMIPSSDNFYQILKQKHLATMVTFTPMPGTSFNPEGEAIKPNWLELVQRSQEYKITLNLESTITVKQETTVETRCSVVDVAPSTDELVLPTDITTKQDDTESINNSVWETASVASDLTRMYVSDEDEKPELQLASGMDHDHADDFGINFDRADDSQFTSTF